MKLKQMSFRSILLFCLSTSLIFSFSVFAQITSDRAPEKAASQPKIPTPQPRPAGCIQKGGSKLITDSQGNFSFKVPDSFLKKLKAFPNKYKVKFKLVKVPSDLLKLKMNNVKSGTAAQLVFVLKAGFDKKFNDIGKVVCKIKSVEEFSLSRAEISGAMFLALNGITPLGGGNGGGNCMLAGEPIPGAEIYVELEPDDEP